MISQGLTQAQVGAMVDLSQGMVSMILTGKRPLTVDELAAFCDALGLSVVDVVRDALSA